MKECFILKKCISIFLSIVMLFSVMPLAFAAGEPVYANNYVGLGDYSAPALGEGGEGEGAGDAASIPAQFSLVDSMPAPRNQNPYGSCWAFATLATVESNLITQELASKDEIDLSELQLIYYMYHPTVDKLGNIAEGEGSYRNDGDLINGGRFDYAMNVLSHWNGLAYEDDNENFSYSNVSALNGNWDPALATDYNDFIVKGYYAINNQDNADALKAAIMENGAATVSYYHDDDYYNAETKAFFSGDEHKNSTNHSVSIVGWDDNYAVENFGELKPENPGAWLIRNSWGSFWGQGGYFWLSYEDQSIEDTSFIALMQKADAYDNNYFFDGGNMYHPSAKVLGAVNKFTAKGNELLKAVSVVFPEDTDVNYSVDIYVNPGANNAFSSWQPVASAHTEGVTTFAGMYTIELANAVPLAAGEKFAVAITADQPVVISYDKYDNHTNSWFVNNATWEDDSSYFINGSGELSAMESRGVARIKAYTENYVEGETVTISADDLQLCTGAVIDAADYLTVDPDTAELTFTVSDTSVATVDANGTVTAVAPGEATLEVRCAAANTRATAPITVKAHELRDVEAKEPTCTEPGNDAYQQCDNCGKVFVDGAEADAVPAIAATGHDLTKTDAKEATEYVDGNIEYWYCSVCEKYFADENGENEIALADTVKSAPYALTKVARKEATCTKDGNIEYYIVTNKENGEFVKNVKLVDGEYVDFAEGESIVIPASHTLTKTEAVEASCLGEGTVGNIEYWKCDVCGKYFADEAAATEITYSKTIAYPKHTMTKTAAKAATCTEDGNIQYYTCSVCERYYKYASGSTELSADALAIPATGHDPKEIPQRDPTCTESGYEAYYVCKNCNKLFSDEACTAELAAPAVIDALGHDYQSEVTLAPSCTIPGITTYTCSRCGDTYQEPIAATGHTYVDGTCTGCGLTQEEIERAEIAELGGPECEYCGRHHGTSWFADFLYAVHRLFKFFKDLFAKIG